MVGAAGMLFERDVETAAIDDAVFSALAGAGRVLLFRGPAGIGKTRLIAEAARRAGQRGMTVLHARGAELEREFTFGIARQLFEPALSTLTDAERAAALAGAASLAGPVVGGGDEPPGSVTGDRLFAVTHGLYWLSANLAATTKLAILVDDLQWADEQSLRWLAYLTHRLADVPALVVLGVRVDAGQLPSPSLAAIADEERAHTFAPEPLGMTAVAEFIASETDRIPTPEVVRACHARSAGNPFVLRELARALTDAGVALDSAGAVDEVGRVLPDTVSRAVLRRLGNLDPAAVEFARAVAVLGGDVQLSDASRLAGLGDEAGARALDGLIAAGFLAPDLPLRFVHPLMREAIYADLPPGRRRIAHRRAADVLSARIPPELIGAHLLECEPRGDANSVAILRRCGARAMAHGAPETAVRYLSRALAEGAGEDATGVLLRELGIAEARVGLPESLEHLETALASAQSVPDVCAATRELALALASRGRVGDAAAALERGIASLAGRDREFQLALIGELGAIGQLDVAWTPRAAAALRSVAPELTGATPGERLVLATYAHVRSNEGASPAELDQLSQRALADGLLLEEQTGDSAAFYLFMYALHRAERNDLVDYWLAAALDDARRRGSLFGTSIGLAVRGQMHWLRGRLRDAEADARMSLDAQLEAGWASVLPLAVHVVAECLLERGEPNAAVALFTETGLGGHLDDQTMNRWAQATRGRALIACGRVDEGIEDLLDCERADMGVHTGLGLLWRSDVALALAARGQHDRAHAIAREQYELSERSAVPRIHGIVVRTVGMLAEGDEARRLLTEAADILAGSSARLEYARTLVELGSRIRRANAPSAARDPLRLGYEIARECGSEVLQAEAAAELAAAGVRLRREALTGWDALTPSERRVADMAKSGMSNPEIAQALFLTRKTIEMHLGRAYRKLGVSGRGELATTPG